MKNKSMLMLAFGLLLFLISCGENKKSENKEAEVSTKAIDACQWLSKDDVESILGTKVGDCKTLVNYVDEDGKNATSLVTYYSETAPDKHVGLLIKRTSIDTTPSSREDFADKSKTEDTMGSGDEMFEAIMKGKDIPGLGDIAFTYEMFGHNLIVFYKGHYQIIITIYGQDSDKNIEFQKKLATKIIDGL